LCADTACLTEIPGITSIDGVDADSVAVTVAGVDTDAEGVLDAATPVFLWPGANVVVTVVGDDGGTDVEDTADIVALVAIVVTGCCCEFL